MNPRTHAAWGLASEWIAANLGATEEQASLVMELVAGSLEKPERFDGSPFAELPLVATELRRLLDEPRDALIDLLEVHGEALLPLLEPIVSSPMAMEVARELVDSMRAQPEAAAEATEEPELAPIAGESVPANPMEAGPVLAARFSEELAAWEKHPKSRQRAGRLRERLRLASSAMRRSGYRTFGTLASEIDATIDEQQKSEAVAPASLFAALRECAEVMDAMGRREFPRHRTHYTMCARLDGVRREIAKAGAAALSERRRRAKKRQREKKPATAPAAGNRKLTELEEIFLSEMSEHLDDMTRCMLVAEVNPNDRETIYALMRSAHSIKGSAAIVGLKAISQLGHAMEDLLVLVRDEGIPMHPSIASAVFRGMDRLQALKREAEEGAEEHNDRTETVIARLHALTKNVKDNIEEYRHGTVAAAEDHAAADGLPEEEQRAAAAAKLISVDVRHLDRLMNIAADMVIGRTRLTAQVAMETQIQDRIERSLTQLSHLGLRLKRGLELTRTPTGAAAARTPASTEFGATELDHFNESDLVARDIREGIAALEDETEALRTASREMEARLSMLAGLVTDLRESVRRARLLPISQVFDRFPRAIRDLSHKLRKPLELKISGETTLLDKQVLDELADPLMHLVRNAADHGIEAPEARSRAGKPAQGTIRLNARQTGGQAIIELSDDGGGIALNRVREKAVERGWMTEAEAKNAKDEELYALLLKSGFSTAREVTDVSGRGVGLDVVANTVERLHGSISIHSVAGKGTTFVVRLPVSLAIAQGLLVRIGEESYAVPTDAIEEVVLLDPRDLRSVGGRPVFLLRNKPVPLLDLRTHFGAASVRSGDGSGPYVLVVGDPRSPSGLVIDSIAGIEEFVQKSFGDYLGKVECMSGATVLADGRVTLILDALQLSQVLDPVHSQLAALETKAERPEEVEELLEPATPLPAEEPVVGEGGEASSHPVLDALPTTTVAPVPETPKPTRRTKQHILAVDDSVSVRRYVAGILEEAGFDVTMAVDGIDALEKLGGDSFDLILTDLEMPRMHGFELITEIRATPKFRTVPIVILTGRMGEKHSRKGLELGAAAYLVKPFDKVALVATIRDILNAKGEAGG